MYVALKMEMNYYESIKISIPNKHFLVISLFQNLVRKKYPAAVCRHSNPFLLYNLIFVVKALKGLA